MGIWEFPSRCFHFLSEIGNRAIGSFHKICFDISSESGIGGRVYKENRRELRVESSIVGYSSNKRH